jgi:hypothetical protein
LSLLEAVVVKLVVGAKSWQCAHSHTVGEEDLNDRQDKHQSLPVFGQTNKTKSIVCEWNSSKRILIPENIEHFLKFTRKKCIFSEYALSSSDNCRIFFPPSFAFNQDLSCKS